MWVLYYLRTRNLDITSTGGTGLVLFERMSNGSREVNNGEGGSRIETGVSNWSGARVVMATLWEVPDVQTARLMIKFFDKLSSNHSVGSALRIAQQETITLVVNGKERHTRSFGPRVYVDRSELTFSTPVLTLESMVDDLINQLCLMEH